MKLFFEYGKRAVALPALPETLLARASKVELQLLLALTASPALMEDYESGEILEAQKVVIRVGAPTPQKWRDMYETYHR